MNYNVVTFKTNIKQYRLILLKSKRKYAKLFLWLVAQTKHIYINYMPQNTQTNYKQNKNTHAQPTACHILHQQNYHTSTVSINNTLHIFTTTPAYAVTSSANISGTDWAYGQKSPAPPSNVTATPSQAWRTSTPASAAKQQTERKESIP